MHDIKYIRENSGDFDAAMKRRGLEAVSAELLALDEERRGVQTELQEVQSERNQASKQIGTLHNPKSSEGVSEEERQKQIAEKTEQVKALKSKMVELEERERTVSESLNQHLAGLPNIMDADVPDGKTEADNVELRVVGDIKVKSGADHVEIGEALGMMDAEVAAKMSGARFTMLSGGLARLERALAQFMLDTHTQEHGYMEVSPPLMIKDDAMFGTGQLPKFAEDQFRTTRGDWLVPTAEVPLTNIVAGEILDEEILPIRYTAHTACFRQEAGSAGKDTRGMLRQHQFYKVEMVSIVAPEESAAEHERMVGCAEEILKKLELPFRIVMLCSGDTGFGARKTYDIEVWLPGQETYREISSVSNCGDFQARRMNARCRAKGDQPSPNGSGSTMKKTRFVHTLNGSGVAVGRALIAVIENYYDPEDGGVFVPEVLKPYMGGVDKITR